MKFLVDVGVGILVETWLQESGFDCKSVREIDPKLSDLAILKTAVLENRLVITMDEDFGELVYRSGMSHAGVLLLRLEGASGEEKRQIVQRLLERYASEIENSFAVYQQDKLRIRK